MSAPACEVRHYGPGGREDGGGIGRLIGYVVDAATAQGRCQKITDTRGPRWSPLASPPRLLAAMAAMAADRALRPGQLHHIHLAGRGSTARKLLLAGVARRIGCRHVLHLHDYDYGADLERRPSWQQAAIGRMFRGADAVVTLGRRDRDTILGLGVPPDRVTILPNAVPDPGPRPAPGTPRVPVILFLGRLSERKGVPELLAALSDPMLAALPWRAVLAGDGPVEHYRAQARALGLGDRVTMPGWLDQQATARLCAEADILVLPSHAEGLAMAVLEGMANGLAVVTTRVGAHDEVLTDGRSALFVPVGDPGALAATLARLALDPALRAGLGAEARALFLARFDIAVYLRRLDDFYAALAERSGASFVPG